MEVDAKGLYRGDGVKEAITLLTAWLNYDIEEVSQEIFNEQFSSVVWDPFYIQGYLQDDDLHQLLLEENKKGEKELVLWVWCDDCGHMGSITDPEFSKMYKFAKKNKYLHHYCNKCFNKEENKI